MNTAFRKTLIAALFVPAVALTGMTVDVFTGHSEAWAQPDPNDPKQERVPSSSSNGAKAELPPCPPGVAASPNCRPWNPPRRADSEDECECEITYQMINGQRVAVRDCYVLLPNNLVYYCDHGKLVQR